ncbi:hypothetical protein P9112_011913 [Eukaryota sp. TZLM1-RC]
MSSNTLVVDVGSSRLRVGYAGQSFPPIDCASYISKARGKGILVGDMALEQHNARSPYDGLLCTSFDFLETLLDNTISSLAPTSPLNIAITEPVANPWVLRQPLCELLFEGYLAPSVSLNVDALAAHAHSTLFSSSPHPSHQSGMLVHVGNRATYTIPITDQGPDMSFCRRIPVGGEQITSYLGQLVSTRNPKFSNSFNPIFYEHLKRSYCFVPANFNQTLSLFANPNPSLTKLAVHHLMASPSSHIVDEEAARKAEERKQKAAERLREMNRNRAKAKTQKSEEVKIEGESERKLSDAQIAAMQAGRQRIMEKKLKEQHDLEEKERIDLEFKENNPAEWLEVRKKDYYALCERITERRSSEKASKRRAAGSDRLRIVSRDLLSENDKSFGVNDEDWEIYRSANKETQEQILAKEVSKALEIEADIRSLDKDFASHRCLNVTSLEGAFALQPCSDPAACGVEWSPEWDSMLHLGTERIFPGELLFKPWLNKIDSMGLGELLSSYRSIYGKLLSKVIVTGAGGLVPGLGDRIASETTQCLPFGSNVDVVVDSNGANSWSGLSSLASQGSLTWFSAQEYYESGVYGITRKQSRFSNYYYDL